MKTFQIWNNQFNISSPWLTICKIHPQSRRCENSKVSLRVPKGSRVSPGTTQMPPDPDWTGAQANCAGEQPPKLPWGPMWCLHVPRSTSWWIWIGMMSSDPEKPLKQTAPLNSPQKCASGKYICYFGVLFDLVWSRWCHIWLLLGDPVLTVPHMPHLVQHSRSCENAPKIPPNNQNFRKYPQIFPMIHDPRYEH